MNEVLIDGRNLPPDPMANAVFIGPSAIDLSLMRRAEAPTERALIAKWKAEDLNAYYRRISRTH